MKLFEKIKRFIRGADRAATDAICEHLDNTAEKLENLARNLDPEAFQESKMRESWEGRPKTTPEDLEKLNESPGMTMEEAAEGALKIQEATIEFKLNADDLQKFVASLIGMGEAMARHLERRNTNNWRKMHGLPMRRRSHRR